MRSKCQDEIDHNGTLGYNCCNEFNSKTVIFDPAPDCNESISHTNTHKNTTLYTAHSGALMICERSGGIRNVPLNVHPSKQVERRNDRMARYHMNKKEREIGGRDGLIEILKKGKYMTIAMCRNNEPYIVTLSYGYDAERNTLYSHTAAKGLKLEFISTNSQVCASVIIDEGYVKNDCKHRYSSVVLWGRMEALTDLEEKKHAMEALMRSLEEEPELLKERFIKNDSSYDKVAMLKLEISEMTGKRSN